MSQLFSIRFIGILIGLGFTVAVLWAFGNGAYTVISEGQLKPATAEHEFHKTPNQYAWSFDGPFGRFDQQQLQRGFKVYDEVCAACHSLKFVAFRDLEQLGYDEGQVKAFAASKQVPDVDPVTQEPTTRPGLPTDYFPHVAYAGAGNPPDLSLMAKARHDGTNYIASLLTGYTEMPAEVTEEFPDFAIPATGYYNPYFANLALAMPAPLADGQVTYDDGTEATVEQMSKDVAAFLTWTAEPTLDKRKQTGWPVLIFLLFATVLAYLSKQQIWAAVKPKKHG
ncbi:cytochrome c1 [Erythrobacter mangrovi]|uniref:Cytochrome c1 n=1 Tax=Erythrobacter mangrovi TaxID=2739433 RepID=A0A7D3XPR4_9SPHN|nr:cytochrome c1 [Erythrobacter mangrovi]QKG70994.1 cytochrome c1 [Erythrobacter mangrovi]